jgi:hypothetical protein
MLFDEQRGPHSTLTKTGPNQITLAVAVSYGFHGPGPKCAFNYTVGGAATNAILTEWMDNVLIIVTTFLF